MANKNSVDEAVVESIEKNDAVLEVNNLRVWFKLRKFGFGNVGHVKAVDGVTFDLGQQEAIAIVGESGCGKTSLMKSILGLYEPVDGTITYEGNNLAEFDKEQRKWYSSQVGYVQQDPFGAIAPFMTIRRILKEALICNGIKDKDEQEKRIREAMEEVRLIPADDFIDKYPHMLSGGQQQRVVIARAIILRQKLLVADEPVSMLDASVRVEVLKLLEKLQQDHHLSVIYITHDLSTVRYFSSRIFVMYAGRIIEKAGVDELLYNAKHPYTEALLLATSEPEAKNAVTFKEIPEGEPPNLVHPPEGCHYHPRCPKKIAGLCDAQEPPEFKISDTHQVKCWLYKEDETK